VPRRRGLAVALILLALPLAACAPSRIAARAALEQFLQDVHAHESAYAYTLLAPAAAARTSFDAFNRAVSASHATFQVVGVRSTSAGRARAVVVAHLPGGQRRRLAVTIIEVGTGGDWMVSAPFATLGAVAVQLLGSASPCPPAGWTGYPPRPARAACAP